MRRTLTLALPLSIACAVAPVACTREADPPDHTAPTTAPTPPAPTIRTIRATFAPCLTGLPEDGMWKCDPVFADVNDDGVLDLAAIPRLGTGPRVWLGGGDGSWREAFSGLVRDRKSCGGGVSLADIDADGHLDLAVADHCNGIFVYLGDGEGRWTLVTEELYPREVIDDVSHEHRFVGAEDIDCGDLDGDGFLDILVSGSDEGGLNVFLGDGTGRTWRWHSAGLTSEGWANRVMLADINDDGHLDAVASHSSGPQVWLNDGRGYFGEASEGLATPMVGGLYTGLAVGDVDGDGRLDIATANWIDGPEVYLQQADGSWTKTPDVFPRMLGGSIGLDLGRVDTDDHLDIVVSGRLEPERGFVRGVFVLLGDGTGRFEHVEDNGLPATGLALTTGVGIADVNGDGIADIAACSGLKVETAAGPTEPILPAHMLLWCGRGLEARESR